jgi:MacB-like periplasmic core domain/FtsX-like permease family
VTNLRTGFIGGIMEILFNDVRYAFRIMRKSPGFTLIIILTLALGIGANTSIFSIVNAVLLRSLPYYDPSRLVKITFNNPGIGLHDIPFSVPELEDLKSRAGVFEEVSVVVSGPTNLTGGKQPEHLELLEVSPNYFSMLGASPQIGRLFGPQDFALGFAEAAVISDGLWRRSYGGDPKILGKRVPHIFRPIYQQSPLPASLLESQIRKEIQTLDPALPVFNVRSMNDLMDASIAPRRFSAELVGVFAAVAMLLSSIGIYGLLAYMVGQRSREIGIRVALGAQRPDILKLILGKGLLLAGTGIAIGLILSAISARMIAGLLYGVHPIDGIVFVTVPLILLVVAFLATYIPARRATIVDPNIALHES